MWRQIRCGYVRALGALALMALGTTAPASATTADMNELPIFEPFRCLICHTETPGAVGTPLNPFGEDFAANLRQWSIALAEVDSDGDGCLNGIELGDSDGDGVPNGNIEVLTTNPGLEDCGASLDATSWGELKALFESR